MNLVKNWKNAIAVAALAMIASIPASAKTISYGFTTPLNEAPWGMTASLQKFDPSLGELKGITVSWSASSKAFVEVDHGVGAGSVLFDKLGSQVQFTTPSSIIIGAPAPAQTLLWAAGSDNPTFFETNIFTVDGLDVVGSAWWSAYVGSGTFDVDIDVNPLVEGFQAFGDFNGSDISTFGGGSMIVSYDYVPEPGTYAMMALGLAGLGISQARRKAKKG